MFQGHSVQLKLTQAHSPEKALTRHRSQIRSLSRPPNEDALRASAQGAFLLTEIASGLRRAPLTSVHAEREN